MEIDTLEVEVTQIDTQGIWFLINDKESFLPFENFPWFKEASVGRIHNVELLATRHLTREFKSDVFLKDPARPARRASE